MKSLEQRTQLYFCFRLLSRKCPLQSVQYLRYCYRPHLSLSLDFFTGDSIAKVSQIHELHHALPNIFYKCVIILTFHIGT